MGSIFFHNIIYFPKEYSPSIQIYISNSLFNNLNVCYHGNKHDQKPNLATFLKILSSFLLLSNHLS